ncbi:hypothetical protein HK414_21340 [Ramlibacter terrae]|uniref:Uncharacterized protein n=1 Tax=Ramlibacter terrae TaxID=2732511 RepID=A0ABX6P6K1_9BURK|nr:hypothetical protein HK414_21340 [Ramlibacter terrae]
MAVISLLPAGSETARLVTAAGGSEWLEFDAVLAPAMVLALEPDGRRFPGHGTVSIRRGFDTAASGERIADALRYIEGCTDDATGLAVDERFGVTLFPAEAAFDRLVARVHWGLPELDLFFDPSSPVIAQDAGSAGALRFRTQPRPREAIASVTLTQRPAVQA